MFNSSHLYGTPSYWVQQFFRESSGATLLNATIQTDSPASIVASAIAWEDSKNEKSYLRIKVFAIGNFLCSINRISVSFHSIPAYIYFSNLIYSMHIWESAYKVLYGFMILFLDGHCQFLPAKCAGSSYISFYFIFLFINEKIIKL